MLVNPVYGHIHGRPHWIPKADRNHSDPDDIIFWTFDTPLARPRRRGSLCNLPESNDRPRVPVSCLQLSNATGIAHAKRLGGREIQLCYKTSLSDLRANGCGIESVETGVVSLMEIRATVELWRRRTK